MGKLAENTEPMSGQNSRECESDEDDQMGNEMQRQTTMGRNKSGQNTNNPSH